MISKAHNLCDSQECMWYAGRVRQVGWPPGPALASWGGVDPHFVPCCLGEVFIWVFTTGWSFGPPTAFQIFPKLPKMWRFNQMSLPTLLAHVGRLWGAGHPSVTSFLHAPPFVSFKATLKEKELCNSEVLRVWIQWFFFFFCNPYALMLSGLLAFCMSYQNQ